MADKVLGMDPNVFAQGLGMAATLFNKPGSGQDATARMAMKLAQQQQQAKLVSSMLLGNQEPAPAKTAAPPAAAPVGTSVDTPINAIPALTSGAAAEPAQPTLESVKIKLLSKLIKGLDATAPNEGLNLSALNPSNTLGADVGTAISLTMRNAQQGNTKATANMRNALAGLQVIDAISGDKDKRAEQTATNVAKVRAGYAAEVAANRDEAAMERTKKAQAAADARLNKQITATRKNLEKQLSYKKADASNKATASRIAAATKATISGYEKSVSSFSSLVSKALTGAKTPDPAVWGTLSDQYIQLAKQRAEMTKQGMKPQALPEVWAPVKLDPSGLFNSETYNVDLIGYAGVVKMRSNGYTDDQILEWLQQNKFIQGVHEQ